MLSEHQTHQKQTDTRQRLIRQGGAFAKRGGFQAMGVDALAQAAGLTSGAVYKHFKNKTGLLEAILCHELDQSTQMLAEAAQRGPAQLDEAARTYLSLPHVKHPEHGCVMPALASEVPRHQASVRDAYAQGLEKMHQALQGQLAPDEAWVMIALCVGAVTVARGLQDPQVQQDILSAAHQHLRHALLCADQQADGPSAAPK